MAIPRYPSYPVCRGITRKPCLRGFKYGDLVLQIGGMRLTTSPCRKKFAENLLREKILEESKAVAPLMMMIEHKMLSSLKRKENHVHDAVK
jgi:hypothetical protein